MLSSRLLSACLLAWFAVVALGVPLPAPPRAAPRSGERFPCENCPCGCNTAEHCWQNCCCHTLPERLAWAEREGVRPPDAALAEARRAGLEIAHWAESRLSGAAMQVETPASDKATCCCCCSSETAAATCDPGKAPSGSTVQRDPADNAADEPPGRRSPGVCILKSMACQGLHASWLALGAVTPPEPFELSISLPAGELCLPLLPPAISPVYAIPTPPPRVLI